MAACCETRLSVLWQLISQETHNEKFSIVIETVELANLFDPGMSGEPLSNLLITFWCMLKGSGGHPLKLFSCAYFVKAMNLFYSNVSFKLQYICSHQKKNHPFASTLHSYVANHRFYFVAQCYRCFRTALYGVLTLYEYYFLILTSFASRYWTIHNKVELSVFS